MINYSMITYIKFFDLFLLLIILNAIIILFLSHIINELIQSEQSLINLLFIFNFRLEITVLLLYFKGISRLVSLSYTFLLGITI